MNAVSLIRVLPSFETQDCNRTGPFQSGTRAVKEECSVLKIRLEWDW
jgi:hypothetical protein